MLAKSSFKKEGKLREKSYSHMMAHFDWSFLLIRDDNKNGLPYINRFKLCLRIYK